MALRLIRALTVPTVVGLLALCALATSPAGLEAAKAAPSPIHRSAAGDPLLPGWAPGGNPTDPQSQVNADTVCGSNSVLVFSARGSGDKYGGDFAHDRIGAWTLAAGNALIKLGWNVRDLQAIYPAPSVPSWKKLAAAFVVGGSGAVALEVKLFRDAASKSWKSVRDELEAAFSRCPTRPILLAGYSQGGILMRYVVPNLPAAILSKIVSVDLIADPTEQAAVDSGLRHPANLDGLLTTDGIDTWAGSIEHVRRFRQRAYPASLRAHVFQYCIKHDLVCNANLGNMLWHWPSEGKTHASYQFAAIGDAAAHRAQRLLLVNGGDLPAAEVSHSYDEFVSASGGLQPYSWTFTDGALPAGLTLGDSGEVTGTPVEPGTYQFTAQVTDGDSNTAIGTYSLTVAPNTSLPGQIAEYDVSNDLGCAMFSSGDTNGEFYGQDACGTFIAVGGQLYGPSSIPAGANLGSYDAWTPIDQSTTGSGAPGDPYVTTTDASADGSPITVAEADTYAVGGDEVGTDVTLSNSSGSSVQLILYHAFDCYPGDSDFGTGTASNGSVSCVSDNFGADGARTLKLTPLTSGSTFVEEYYGSLWSDIAAQGLFSDTVYASVHDTSEGLAWPVTVPANGSITIHFTTDLLNTQ